jgi:DNA polymerase-1
MAGPILQRADDELWLVDGSNFLFRAYHALPPLSTKAGVPSGAVFGFTQMLVRLETDFKPPRLAVVFDAGAKSFRNDLYTEYKAHRPPAPDDLIPQFSLVRQVVEAFSIPVLEATELEADDLIATLAARAKEQGLRVVVVSSDKDLMQLVDEHCVLLDTMKNVTFDTAAVTEKFGVPPERLGDVLALMGDSVDNVPGVPGVGPKTAAALVQAFGGTEQMLGRIEEVAGLKGLRGAASVAEKLKANIEQLRLSRKLVALDDAATLTVSLDDLKRRPIDGAKVGAKLRELEFLRLADRFDGGHVPAAAPPSSSPSTPTSTTTTTTTGLKEPESPSAPSSPSPSPSPSPVVLGRPVEVIADEKALEILAGEISRTTELGLSLWVTPGPSLTAIPIGLAIAFPHRPSVYLPLEHRYLACPTQLGTVCLAKLRTALDAPRTTRFVHDSKEVEIVLRRYGASLGKTGWDPALASYLLDPSLDHSLSGLATTHLADLFPVAGHASLPPQSAIIGKGAKAAPLESVEVARAAAQAGLEAECALAVGLRLRGVIEQRGMTKLLDELERPLALVLADIEPHGILLDREMMARLSKQTGDAMAALEAEVDQVAGGHINLGSPKQLQELLFGKLGLPPVRRTKTGLSTDADVLEELAPMHPVARKILDHRVLSKLKGTYLDTLPALVDPRNGRLHTSYKQTIAATGRLSSVEPNLQNIPIRTELGKEIRRAFISEPGNVLVVADYSQIELRVLAHLSGDAVLTDSFQKGQDVHERTVVEMFGEPKRADPDMRRVAKMINYGIVYGLSDFGLAERLGIDRAAARSYIEGYNRTYAGVAGYMEHVIEEAKRDGGARTLFGRFRPLHELASKNAVTRRYGERMARNTPIQGTAADLLKIAMIDVEKLLAARGGRTRMLLTVHDELVLEAPEDEAAAIAEGLRKAMEGVHVLSVPLVVDVGIGRSWADAK